MRSLSADFPLASPGALGVALDFPNNTDSRNPAWSQGGIASAIPGSEPTLQNPWTLYGWTLNYTAFTNAVPQSAPGPYPGALPFARLGDIWAGLAINGPNYPAQPLGKTPLPSNLSTFSKVFDASNDPPFQLWDFSNANVPVGAPRGVTYLFPQPLVLENAEQVSMQLILMPSLLFAPGASVSNNAMLPFTIIQRASYALLYDDSVKFATAPLT